MEKTDLYVGSAGERGRVADYPGAVLRIWKPDFNAAPWPLWQMMWIARFHILYAPIAKNACTSIKLLMTRLALAPNGAGIPESDIHGWLDNTNTGLQLGDLDESRMRGLLRDPDVARVTVLRSPRERIVSAFLEKFVVNRAQPGAQFHTRPVVAAVCGKAEPDAADFERSVTFREFLEYVVAQKPEHLDPHWSPQVLHLGGFTFEHVFDARDLRPFVDFLRRQGVPGDRLEIPELNRGRTGRPDPLPDAMDQPAAMLEKQQGVAVASFFDRRLDAVLCDYFREDLALLEAAGRR